MPRKKKKVDALSELDDLKEEDFVDAVKDVLLAPPAKPPKWENRKPTRQQLETKWRLAKRPLKPR